MNLVWKALGVPAPFLRCSGGALLTGPCLPTYKSLRLDLPRYHILCFVSTFLNQFGTRDIFALDWG